MSDTETIIFWNQALLSWWHGTKSHCLLGMLSFALTVQHLVHCKIVAYRSSSPFPQKKYQKASVTASVEMTHYKMASHNAHTSHHFVRKTQTKVGTPTSQHLVKYNYHKLRLYNIYDIKFLQPPMHETGMCTKKTFLAACCFLKRNDTSSAWTSLKIIQACAHFKSAFISKAVGFPRTFLSGFGIKQENAFIEPWRTRLVT